jgi:glycosyltransferase involved in cell wall biosynthesis
MAGIFDLPASGERVGREGLSPGECPEQWRTFRRFGPPRVFRWCDLRVLLSAFACYPGRGSEPGVGWELARHVAARHQVCVLTDIRNREGIQAAVRDGLATGVEFEFVGVPGAIARIPRRRGLHYIYYLAWQIKVLAVARRRHAVDRFDLVHHVTYVNSWVPSFMGSLGIPFVWNAGPREKTPIRMLGGMSLRSAFSEVIRSITLDLLGGLTLMTTGRAASLILSGSRPDEWPASLPVRRFPVGGLSLEERNNLALLPQRDQGPLRIAAIGRLIGWKGYSLGLRAFARLSAEVPEAECWIIGDGPERRHLERLAHRLRCHDKVRFTGWLPRDEVLHLIGEVDVLLHPSLHEQFGYVLLEAMAARRPVVCLDTGPASLVVGEGCGILVRPGKPGDVIHELSRALTTLGRDRPMLRRMGERAREWANEMWSWEAVGERVLECYEEIT